MTVLHTHRSSRALAAITAIAACLVPMSTANAAGHRAAAGNQPFDLSADYCGFPVHFQPVKAKEYYVKDSVADDGTETLRVTGKLVATLTNRSNGRSITVKISGPGTFRFAPDGSESMDVQGRVLLWLTPSEQAIAGLPGLSVTDGHVAAFWSSAGLEQFSLSGTATDVCAELS